MQCQQCGGETPASALFCPHCGTQLSADNGSPESRAEKVARLQPGGSRSGGKHPPEHELWSGTYSPKAMVGPALLAALLTVGGAVGLLLFQATAAVWIWFAVGAVILWAAIGLVVLYRRMTVHYRLTTYRLFHEVGLLHRTRDRIEVIDINDVTLTQGLIERLFGVGTIHIISSDVTHRELLLPGIEDARRIIDLIDDTRRAERYRRGLFMENIGPTSAV